MSMKRKGFSGIVLMMLLTSMLALALNIQPAKALGDVKILSHSSFYDSLNNLWVVGEVENTGDMATKFTKITATFFDSSNQVIAIKSGYSELDVLLPGRKSPFKILLTEGAGALNVHNYTLNVSWTNYAAGMALGLEILSNSSYIDEFGWMHVTGIIKNRGAIGASYVKVIATFYDSEGIVVGEDFAYAEPSYLSPNQTGTFDIELIYTQQVIKVARYSLTAESHEYALIPEIPSFLILLSFMAATLLTVRAYRRKRSNGSKLDVSSSKIQLTL